MQISLVLIMKLSSLYVATLIFGRVVFSGSTILCDNELQSQGY